MECRHGCFLLALLAPLASCRSSEDAQVSSEAPAPERRTASAEAKPTPSKAPVVAAGQSKKFVHPALRAGTSHVAGDLEFRTPHNTRAHQAQGSGHTHCAPDHSGIEATQQQERLSRLGVHHRHHFVWMTAHNFVAPDPGVPGIQHMFGVEIYTKQQQGERPPHMLALLPNEALVGLDKRPFGVHQFDLQGASSAIRRAGGLAVLAHPSRYSPAKEALLDVDEELWGIEVLSGSTRPEKNAVFVDDRLTAGKYTCLSAGGDIHDEDYKLTTGYQLVDVSVAEPSREELFGAIEKCNFFACGVKSPRHGPIRRPKLELEGRSVRFSSETVLRTVRFVGKAGATLYEAKNTTRASYAPQAEDGYVRVEAVSADGNARCYSQPTWLTKRP